MNNNKDAKTNLNEDEINELLQKAYEKKTQKFMNISKSSFLLQDNESQKKIAEDNSQIKLLQRKMEQLENEKNQQIRSSFYQLDYWKYHISNNLQLFTNMFIDFGCVLITHPFNTIKTRIQSRHPVEDVAFFMKNKVDQQSLYKGISHAMIGSQIGIMANIVIFKYCNDFFYDQTINHTISFMISDILTTPFRIAFDVRKQFIQINNSKASLSQTLNAIRRSFLPVMVRDVLFRIYYNAIFELFLFKKYYYYERVIDQSQKQEFGNTICNNFQTQNI